MKNKNTFIISLFFFASIACSVTRTPPTEKAISTPASTLTSVVTTVSATPAPRNEGFIMDNTIIGAIIGAVATILGAFISRTYADSQISHSKSSPEIKPLVRTIIQVLSLLRVTGASVFVIKHNKTYIDTETGISIAIHNYSAVNNVVDITYHLPGQLKPQIVKQARLGWRASVNYQNNLYVLTLVSMNGSVYSFDARFDFRKIDHVMAELNDG